MFTDFEHEMVGGGGAEHPPFIGKLNNFRSEKIAVELVVGGGEEGKDLVKMKTINGIFILLNYRVTNYNLKSI